MARKPKAKQSAQARKAAAGRRPSGVVVVLAFAVAIAAAVGLVVGGLVLRNDDDAAPATSAAALVDLEGIPQSGTVLGSPESEVTLIEYADLQCPACRAYTEVVLPTVVNDYVRPGRVKAEFRGLAFIGSDSEKALRLVLAAGLQDRLWHLQEALYRIQGSENSGWVTGQRVRALAGGIPDLDADQLFVDAESDEVTAMMVEDAQQADDAEVTGTPSLFIQVGDAEPYKVEAGISPTEVAAALDSALGR